MKNEFEFTMPATLSKSSDGKTWVQGIASTEDKDLQGEIVKAEGIVLSYFLNSGFINDNHAKDTSGKIGVPTEAKITKNALWIKGYLLDTERARAICELANALEKSGSNRKLAWSIEGKILERDKKDPNVVTKCWLKDVALTAEPVNPHTYADFSKSISANVDLRDVFVDEPIVKADVMDADVDEDEGDEEKSVESKNEEKAEKHEDIESAREQEPEKPIRQKDVEEKDAEKTAREALDVNSNKKDVEKEINDVPVARRPKTKSIDSDIVKGFVKIHSIGGEREFGDKKIPIHTTKYKHNKSGNTITVTGKEGAFAVLHSFSDGKNDPENIGMHIFVDDPKNKKKATELVDEHLKGFGIKHQFADKNKLMGKSFIVAQDDSHKCDICEARISKGSPFAVAEGKRFCDDSCIEKALVTGYAFGVTDQTGGSALRVEDLEGNVRDNEFGSSDLNLKKVRFDTAHANGGQVGVTLKDALDYFESRGIPQQAADRLLVLLIQNNGLPRINQK